MSPRAYKLGQRQAAIEETRARIVGAARELLADEAGFTAFTIDAVARRAGVARMTVYYQFDSKIGLLEALCDSLAMSGGMQRLRESFGLPDARDALLDLIAVFGTFWQADRAVTRRLRGLAALDPEIAQVMAARNERRRHGLDVIIRRIAASQGEAATMDIDEAVAILQTLTSFETFDSLAGAGRSIEDVTPTVQRLALAALAIPE